MHLVKWIRRNMNKLMAIFVIVIMVAFIMPSVLQQLAKPRMRGRDNAMWLYGKDKINQEFERIAPRLFLMFKKIHRHDLQAILKNKRCPVVNTDLMAV